MYLHTFFWGYIKCNKIYINLSLVCTGPAGSSVRYSTRLRGEGFQDCLLILLRGIRAVR